MATDTRELILQRLTAILQSLGAATVTRNRGELDVTNTKFPALMLLDSDEQSALLFDTPTHIQRPTRTPNIDLMQMLPEIYIQLKPTVPHNEQMGSQLNIWRVKVLYAIWTDISLKSLVGTNGSVAYKGCETDLGRRRELKGMMRLNFTILYPLRASDLAP